MTGFPDKLSLRSALEDPTKAHLRQTTEGVEVTSGKDVTALERLLLDLAAEVRANLNRYQVPVPRIGYNIGSDAQSAENRVRVLLNCYELLTGRAGNEALHLVVAAVSERASAAHKRAIARWLESPGAAALPATRRLGEWPLRTFSTSEDRLLARLRRRSPQLEDVAYTDDPDTDVAAAGPAPGSPDHDQAVAVLHRHLRRAQVAGADTLLVGKARMMGLDLDHREAWAADHDSDTRAAYKLLSGRYGPVLHLSRYGCDAARDHLLWGTDDRRRKL